MTDLTAAVAAALGKIVDSGKIEAAIEKTLEQTLARVIDDQLGDPRPAAPLDYYPRDDGNGAEPRRLAHQSSFDDEFEAH
jgi:hypothetical protein